MNNPEQMKQYNSEQEIDLVDLAAILWRRKAIFIVTTIVVIMVGFYLFGNRQGVTVTSSVSMGELTTIRDGSEQVDKIMTLGESKQLLDSVFIPSAVASVAKEDNTLYQTLISNIKIDVGKEDKEGRVSENGVLVMSKNIGKKFSKETQDIFDASISKLIQYQNRVYEQQQAWLVKKIDDKKLELSIKEDQRNIELNKLALATDQFDNSVALNRNKNEELIKQEILKQRRIVDSAENELGTRKADKNREQIYLTRLDDLEPLLKQRIQGLEEELIEIDTSRTNLHEKLFTGGSSSSVVTDAALAIDRRDERIRSQIDNFTKQLLIEFPVQRKEIQWRLSSIDRAIYMAEENLAIARQSEVVYHIDREYRTGNLEKNSDSITTRISGFEATNEAEILRLKASIATLELSLGQSTPSVVLFPTRIVQKSEISLLVLGGGLLFVGGMLGCFLAFFLELISHARLRISETT